MKIGTIAVLLAGVGGMLNASVIFTLGNHTSDDVNILLNSGATGTTITGTLTSFPNVAVDFTSTQVLGGSSSGQAGVFAVPEGTPLTNNTISLENDLTYRSLIINPFLGGQCQGCTGGPSSLTVNAVNSSGIAEAPIVYTGLTVENGSNFLTITTTGGESIVSTTISVPGGFRDLRQPRISGSFASTATPEPGSFVMLLSGVGLVGIGRVIRAVHRRNIRCESMSARWK